MMSFGLVLSIVMVLHPEGLVPKLSDAVVIPKLYKKS